MSGPDDPVGDLARRLETALTRLMLGGDGGPILGPPPSVLTADDGEGRSVFARLDWSGAVDLDRLIETARAAGARRVEITRVMHCDRRGVTQGRSGDGVALLSLWCAP